MHFRTVKIGIRKCRTIRSQISSIFAGFLHTCLSTLLNIWHFCYRPQLYYKVQSVRAARNIYILPFSIGVWTSLCSLLLAITVALTFILRRESQLPQQEFGLLINEGKTVDKPVQLKWELSEVLLVTTGAVCQQGICQFPRLIFHYFHTWLHRNWR